MNHINPFVSSQYLEQHLYDNNVKIVDASWYLPSMERDADAEFLLSHIPNAIRFDLDKIAIPNSGLPHMAVSSSEFSLQVEELGISNNDEIIIYDGMGLFSAARVWWNFKIMGAENVSVLAGGFPKWIEEGHVVQSGVSKIKRAVFKAKMTVNSIYSEKDILSLLKHNPNSIQIVDVRPQDRFFGKIDEPRPNLKRGHIPNSKNLPFTEIIRNGEIVPPKELLAKLETAEIDINKPIVTSCGSGVTAPILNLALATINIECLAVYDGSWAQWGGLQNYPINNPSLM